MTDSARDRLAVLLAGASEPVGFSASRTAPAGGLQLEVRGVGPIKLPVSQAQAKQLCLLGRPARYGRGEQTLMDRRVRDTWEIPKSRVKIDKRCWDETLVPVLGRLGRDLGLPSGRTLRAELHSMLVYAPGQFFVEHQDSEKDDAMVGSPVVSLPSTFKGGALEVRHGGRTATYRGSKKALSCVAFYSDCRHEVKPVRSGYRVVLTYNLLVGRERAGSVGDPDPELVVGLSDVTLDRWISPRDGRLEKVGLSIGTDEVCASTPSGDLEPYTSEYEGYMGNWGTTLDVGRQPALSPSGGRDPRGVDGLIASPLYRVA